jgi:phosphomannomutase
MGLLIVEMVSASHATLYELVEDLLNDVGPAFYERTDLRLRRPVAKQQMVDCLVNDYPAQIGGESIVDVTTMDGVKYILSDDSWLLIRPSGTEPVLRVYAEGRSQGMVKALLGYGQTIAENIC